MRQYDPNVLNDYAEQLYSLAFWVVVRYTTLGILLGVFIGYLPTIVWYVLNRNDRPLTSVLPLVFCAVLGALIFGAIGSGKAFRYKLEAQTVLCQMQIENNTRAASLMLNRLVSAPQPDAKQPTAQETQ